MSLNAAAARRCCGWSHPHSFPVLSTLSVSPCLYGARRQRHKSSAIQNTDEIVSQASQGLSQRSAGHIQKQEFTEKLDAYKKYCLYSLDP